jgi:signal transduction histidine kinase
VEDILGLVRNQASFRNLTITTDLDPLLPAAMADGDQIRQVILNVILNAADAMAGSGTLGISSRIGAAAESVRVTIADTGPGIPDEVKEKLFEPFFTTKSTEPASARDRLRHHGAAQGRSRGQRGPGTTVTIASLVDNDVSGHCA